MTKANKTEAVEFDLSNIDTTAASDKGAKVPILHPTTKEPLGINITILGKHSNTFRELVRERINKRIQQESLAAKRGKPLEPRTAEQVEQEALEMLVACTIGWETEIFHFNEKGERVVDEVKQTIRLGENRLEFTQQNALLVYSKILPIREQVDEAIGDLENFIQA